MKQAEQKKVLADFRAGAFNTLVATCIGEEGLDIPQVCQCLAMVACIHHIQYLERKCLMSQCQDSHYLSSARCAASCEVVQGLSSIGESSSTFETDPSLQDIG